MSPWERILEKPDPRGHLVQLYGADEGALIQNVSRYLREGWKQGDGLLVIAEAQHAEAFRRALRDGGVDSERAVRDGRLAFFDAQQTLDSFMVDGQPEWRLFEDVVGAAMREVRPLPGQAGLRAYGEMVGILWKARHFAAAVRLEQFWNKLLGRAKFSLFCGYEIDVFGGEFHMAAMDALLCAHTHLVPAETGGSMEAAISSAMNEVLGVRAQGIRELLKTNFRPAWAVMSRGEAAALWLRNNIPAQAEQILARARELYQPC